MINLDKTYATLISSDVRYHIVTGGRGSGKSFSINTILCLMMIEEKRSILFLRKTLTSAHISIIPEFIEKLELLGVSDMFHITKTEIVNKHNDSIIYFRGIQTSSSDNTANLKSINGVSVLVIDEAEELTDETIFDRMDLSVRQKGVVNKVIIALNPCTKTHFLYERFFESKGVNPGDNIEKGNVNYIHTTYLNNIENLDQSFIDQVELMKATNPSKYEHQILGGWLPKAEGVIFEDWELGEFVDTGYKIFGLDFGFSHDPTAMARVSIDRPNKKIYLKEECYKTKMTTSDIVLMLSSTAGLTSRIIADSAEPRLITELAAKGFNIHPAIKGQGSVSAGIAILLDWKLIIDPSSENLIREANNYAWHDKKSGTPVDDWNHLWDAIRYAVGDLLSGQSLPRGNFGSAVRSAARQTSVKFR